MPFACLRKEQVDRFKRALKGKEIDVFKLMKMSTEERTTFLKKFVGEESAKTVNTLFEEKLILKNKLQGIKNWAAKVGEVGRYDPAKKAEMERLLSDYRAKQQERMFSPKEDEAFLADLVEEKFGTRISEKEAKNIFDLQKKSDDLRKSFDEDAGEWASPKDRFAYGAAEVASQRYVEALKGGDVAIKDMIRETLRETKSSWRTNKPKTIRDLLQATLKTIGDNSISMVASFDNSFLGRQGLKTLFTEPQRFLQAKARGVEYKNIWLNSALKSFKDMWDTLGGKKAKEALMADIVSRKNNLNGRYEESKVFAKSEEQFPTSLPEKVPVIGRAYKASQDAFTNSGLRMRADLYDFLDRLAEKNGVEMNKAQIEDIGRVVNSLTARGALPRNIAEASRLLLWAPKMLKANWDVLTGHTLGSGLETSFARKQAALNMTSVIATSAAIMMIANSLKPGSAETDPRSSNFGKIKVGNTTFDYTGGMASLVVLASRVASMSSKSASTGVVSKLNTGEYASRTAKDVIFDFLEGKTTPGVKAVLTWLEGRDFSGKKPTITSLAYQSFTPIMLQNALDLKDDNSVQAVLGVLLDGLGINANTYIPEENWDTSTTKAVTEFKTSVDDKTFSAANKEYNKRVNEWIQKIKLDPAFSTLSDEDKKKEVTKQKKVIKDEVLLEFAK